MQTKLLSWLSLIAVLALFISHASAQGAAGAAAPAAAGTNQIAAKIIATVVVGKVTYEDINDPTKAQKDLTVNATIYEHTIVHTGTDARVVLLFANGATINLAAKSDLNINTFTQDPFAGDYVPSKETDEPSISTTDILLTQGELVGNVKKLKVGGPIKSKFTVGTPVGAAGIRGTTFKIVYTPSGNGRTYNFIMTTLEGSVEVTIKGTVNATPVMVNDNKEVTLSNVEINATTNEVTATTATGQTATVTAAPASTDAPTTTTAQVQLVATQLAQSIIDKVFTTPTGSGTGTGGTGTPNGTPDPKKDDTKKDDSGSPGSTTQPQRVTN